MSSPSPAAPAAAVRLPKGLRARGGVFHYRLHKDGREFAGSLGTSDLAEAQRRLAATLARLADADWYQPERLTIDEGLARFLSGGVLALKESTIRRYRSSFAAIREAGLTQRPMAKLDARDLTAFADARLKAGIKGSTVKGDLMALSGAFAFAIARGWINTNPVVAFLKGRDDLGAAVAKTRFLSAAEEDALLDAASPRLREIFAFAIDSLLRKAELLQLEWRDVDLAARMLTVRAEIAKSGRERRVPILARSVAILSRWRAGGVRQGEPVVTKRGGARYDAGGDDLNRALERTRRRAEHASGESIARVTCHDLRRTGAVRLLVSKRQRIEAVSRWLGHTDVRVTQRHYAFLDAIDLQAELPDGW